MLPAPVTETLPQATAAVVTPVILIPFAPVPFVVIDPVLAKVSGPVPLISTALPVPVVAAPATVAWIAPAPPLMRNAFAPLAVCLPPLIVSAPAELITVPVAPISVAVTLPVVSESAVAPALTVTPLPVGATVPTVRLTGAVELMIAPCALRPVVVTLPRLPVTPLAGSSAPVAPSPVVFRVAPDPCRLSVPAEIDCSAVPTVVTLP